VLVEAYNATQPIDAPQWGPEHRAAFDARATADRSGDAASAAAPLPVIPAGRLLPSDLAAVLFQNATWFFQIPFGHAQLAGAGGAKALLPASSELSDAGTAAQDSADAPAVRAEPLVKAPACDKGIEGPPPLSAASASLGDAGVLAPPPIQYRCRVCRTTLFTSDNIKPHDSGSVRPSPATAAAAAAAGLSGAPVKGRGGASSKPATAAAAPAAADDELAYSRWHTAKGKTVKHGKDVGPCRMLQVDRLPWMQLAEGGGGDAGGGGEGSLLCPHCRSKVGQFNLAGLKCSCGLVVVPGFKVPRDRVDEALASAGSSDSGAALEAALAAAAAEEQLGDLLDNAGGSSSDSGGGGAPGKDKVKRVKPVRNKVISFRNKDFSKKGQRASREEAQKSVAQALAPMPPGEDALGDGGDGTAE
jgi:hypothetical protein